MLRDELELVRAYLELMHLRMPDRLEVQIDVDPTLLGVRFPPMALLTLVENAVRHGIDPSEQGGRIEVRGTFDAATRRACVWVADTGVGLRSDERAGTGLANLRERLRGVFGADAAARAAADAPRGVRAEIGFTRAGGTGAGMRATTALIADDEPLLRERLAAHLARLWPELQVVAAGAQRPRGGRAVRAARGPTSSFSTCTCRA